VSQTEPARRSAWRGVLIPAVALAALYVIWAPHTADLAGQTARGELFDRSGLVPYWSGWYAGITTTGYSLTAPPLLGWLGPVWLGGLSVVGTAIVAVPLLRAARRPRAGAAFLVIAATLNVISGRTTFAVGTVVALAGLLAAERRRTGIALLLGALASLSSPVAGLLLLVAVGSLVLRDGGRRWAGAGLGVGVLAGLGIVTWLANGEGGYEPFTRTSLLMSVGTTLVVVLSPVGKRVRAAAALTIAMLLVVYLVHSAVGANATRIAVLAAAPALVAASRSKLLLVPTVAVASLLPLAQLHNDLSASQVEDNARSFVAPLQDELTRDPAATGHRVEVVDTATHWPSTYLVPDVALARGWERQIDESRNPLFYGRAPLTAATYRGFLDRNAVAMVAVAQGVPLDYGATGEAALVATGLPYLREVWRNADWRVYAVDAPTPMVVPPLTITATSDTGFDVVAPAPGSYQTRLRWSPYLVVDGGTVRRGTDGNAVLNLDVAGHHEVHAVWRIP
jgi:hypothetical protein